MVSIDGVCYYYYHYYYYYYYHYYYYYYYCYCDLQSTLNVGRRYYTARGTSRYICSDDGHPA